MITVSVAGAYEDRGAICTMLMQALSLPSGPITKAQLACLEFMLRAEWLNSTVASDEALTKAQVQAIQDQNKADIRASDVLVYVPKLGPSTLAMYSGTFLPAWTPGRLIDYGIAVAFDQPIVICGPVESACPYFRGARVRVCEPKNLAETIRGMFS